MATLPAVAVPQRDKIKLLIICAGNTSRSPMAEIVARDQLNNEIYEIKSGGIDICDGDEEIIPFAAQVIRERYNFDITGRLPVPVTLELLEWSHKILVCGNMMRAEIRIYFNEIYDKKVDYYLNTYTSKLSGEEMNNVPDPSDGEWWEDYFTSHYDGLTVDNYRTVLDCMINDWQPQLTKRLEQEYSRK